MIEQKHIYPLRPTIAQCVERISELSGVSVEAIQSRDQTDQVAAARRWAMHEARRMTGKSLPIIGRHIGGRDHSTVVYSLKKFSEDNEGSGQSLSKTDLVARKRLRSRIAYWKRKVHSLEAQLKAEREARECQ